MYKLNKIKNVGFTKKPNAKNDDSTYGSVSCSVMQFEYHLPYLSFSLVIVEVAMQLTNCWAALSCALWFHFVCVSRMKGSMCVCEGV